jgi:hypothetical protein
MASACSTHCKDKNWVDNCNRKIGKINFGDQIQTAGLVMKLNLYK